MYQFIVNVGNPVDGFTHYGPFPDHEAAQAWVELGNTGDNPWWIASLSLVD